MSDTLMTIIGIFLAVILMFIFPIMEMTGKNDEISQTIVQVAVSDFVNKVSTQGKITQFDYNELVHKLYATGNSYDIQIEAKILDDNPRRDVTTANSEELGEYKYYSVYTNAILEKVLGEENGEYVLKKDDYIVVTAKNTNITIATQFKNMFYKLIGKETYTIGTSSSSVVVNGGDNEKGPVVEISSPVPDPDPDPDIKLNNLEWKTDYKPAVISSEDPIPQWYGVCNIDIKEDNSVCITGSGGNRTTELDEGIEWTIFGGAGRGLIWLESELNIKQISFKYNLEFGDSFTAAGIMLNVKENGNHIKPVLLAFCNTSGHGGEMRYSYNYYCYSCNNTWSLFNPMFIDISGNFIIYKDVSIKLGGYYNMISYADKNSCDYHYGSWKDDNSKVVAKKSLEKEGEIVINYLEDGYEIIINNNEHISITGLENPNIKSLGFFSDHYAHNCTEIGEFNITDIEIKTE